MCIRDSADTDPEAAAALERIARMAESIQNEDSVQKTFNRQMGGQAAMKMVLDALEKAESENDRLIRDYAEAIRRIAQAEAVVKPSERFRIDDAKTKLKRMERHKQMAAGMCEMLRHDVCDITRTPSLLMRRRTTDSMPDVLAVSKRVLSPAGRSPETSST